MGFAKENHETGKELAKIKTMQVNYLNKRHNKSIDIPYNSNEKEIAIT